ncbi:O-antigen ligase family protein [Cellulophaga baltica]|uniref:O-antigen ligase family protein n=1 Tax=Cellulophaga TaxID=104264 RepID=UPI001C069E6A|nr:MULTISPECIES: O-antigen ligase family protein [Cellulophaga]MBU2996742.1 O-antigen ligase family protein [Cellulophaga baltica]MDO6768138.1 O-antigen ligase family protein [Cellulophaga sp. 1_MG-2023]
MLNILKYIILSIFILNAPGASLQFLGSGIGSALSYLSFLLLIIFYVLNKPGRPNAWMISIGLIYFLISGIQIYQGETSDFLTVCIKYFIVIICGSEVIKKTTANDLYVFLSIGALSILINAIFFGGGYSRYSGLYLNPNAAGFICISCYTLSYAVKNKRLKNIGRIIAVVCGILTFSRTFIVILILVNLLSLINSIKNIKYFAIGFGILTLIIIFGDALNLDNPRFLVLKAAITGEQNSSRNYNIDEDSRTETWAHFYDAVENRPFLGNGYGAFQKGGVWTLGSHNTFLLIIGEAGIIAFLFIILFYINFLISGIRYFKIAPNILMQSIALILFLMAAHNYFILYYILFISMWIQYNIKQNKEEYEKNLFIN